VTIIGLSVSANPVVPGILGEDYVLSWRFADPDPAAPP